MARRPRKQALLVLGMHRSGTSAVTRTVNLLGWRTAKKLLGPSDTNSSGHWEPSEAVAINDQLMEGLDRSWADPKPLPAGWTEQSEAKSAILAAEAFLRANFSGPQDLVLKDPRMCRLLPIWLEAISRCEMEPLCLIVCRNPLAVSESLKNRDAMHTEHAMLLWQTYMLEAELGTRGKTRAFVQYDRLLADWESELGAAFDELGVQHATWSAGTKKAVDAFLDSAQQHHRYTTAQLMECSSIDKKLRDTFQAFGSDSGDADQVLLDKVRKSHQAMWDARSPGSQASDFVAVLPATYISRSRDYDRQGLNELAIEAVRQALDLGPNIARCHHFLGKLLAKDGRFDEAETAQRDAIALNGNSAPFHAALSHVLNNLDRLDEAIESARAAADKGPGIARHHHQLGNLFAKAGRLNEAEAALRNAIALDDGRAPIHNALSHVLNRLGRLSEAIEAARNAAGKGPDNVRYHHHLGNLLAKAGRLEQAEAALRTAIALDGSRAPAHSALSQVLDRLGRLNEAIGVAQVAADKGPDFAHCHYHLGKLFDRAGRLNEAEAALRNAIAIDSNCAPFHRAISKVLSRLGRMDEAVEAGRKAVEAGGQLVADYDELAELLAIAGRIEQAHATRNKAIEIGSRHLGLHKQQGDLASQLSSRCREIDIAALDPEALTSLVVTLAWCGSRWWSNDLERSFCEQGQLGDEPAQWPLGGVLAEEIHTPILQPENVGDPPVLSVMIPVYNLKQDRWLRQCIESVLIQDKGDGWAEIVVVDDASSNDVAKRVAASFGSRVTYRCNPENLGIVENHNNCIKLASGKFVHILHQDDRIEPGFYDALLDPLSKDDDLVAGFTSARTIDSNGEQLAEQQLRSARAGILEDWSSKLAQRQQILFPTIIVRRSAYESLGGFSASLIFAFDWEMWGRLAAAGPFWYEPRVLAHFRSHAGSATNNIPPANRVIDSFRTIAYLLAKQPASLRPAIGQIAFNRLLIRDWRYVFAALTRQDGTPELYQLIEFLLKSWPEPDDRDNIRQALERFRRAQPSLEATR